MIRDSRNLSMTKQLQDNGDRKEPFGFKFQIAHITPVLRIIDFYLDTETSENIYLMKITVRVLDSETELYLLHKQ